MTLSEQTLNAIFDNPFVQYAWLYVPLCVLALSLYLNRRQHLAIRIISPFLLFASTFDFCFSTPVEWALRDGLGGGMVESHGSRAVSFFMDRFTPTALEALLPFTIGLLVCSLPWFFENKTPKKM